MHFAVRPPSLRALLFLVLSLAACTTSSSPSGGGAAPVIEDVQPLPVIATKRSDGRYDAIVYITAHDDGVIATARIDMPSDSEPVRFKTADVVLDEKKLERAPVNFFIDGAAGPGTGDASLVLIDDAGNVTKKKILVTMTDQAQTPVGDGGSDAGSGVCTNEALPAPPSSCTVAGNYVVSADVVCPNDCGESGFQGVVYEVSEAGGEATFTNGSSSSPVVFTCTLSGCNCTRQNGDAYVFSATGFVGTTGVNRGTACEFAWLEKGVRQ